MPIYQIECRVPNEESEFGNKAYGRTHIFNVKASNLQKANEIIEQIKQSLRVAGRLVEDARGLHV